MKKENELVRRRMELTGERYTVAKSKLRAQVAFERWIDCVARLGAIYTVAWRDALAHTRQGIPALPLGAISPEQSDEASQRATTEYHVLLALLERGTDEEIARLAAIMWIGRSSHRHVPGRGGKEFVEQRDHARSLIAGDGRANFLSYVVHKPLGEHLPAGLRVAAAFSFDVNAWAVAHERGTSPAGG
jgi:hypothetical protein